VTGVSVFFLNMFVKLFALHKLVLEMYGIGGYHSGEDVDVDILVITLCGLVDRYQRFR
jgi:hypothetical protein